MAQGKEPIMENQDVNVGESGEQPMSKMTAAEVMQKYNENAYKNWKVNVLEACPHCNRTFLPEKLPIHLKGCSKDKPLKKPNTKGDNPVEEEAKGPMLGLAAREAAELKKGQFGPGVKVKNEKISENE